MRLSIEVVFVQGSMNVVFTNKEEEQQKPLQWEFDGYRTTWLIHKLIQQKYSNQFAERTLYSV